MTEKSIFRYKVDPRRVDFTERASISSMCDIILEAAGEDAYKRGFGIDVLAERNLGWVLSRMCVELDYMPAEYSEFTIRTWISDYNRLASTRNFTLTDDEGRMFGRAVSQWCMLDFSTRMPADVNLLARMHEGVMVDAPSPCERPRRIAAVGSEPTAKHRVVYSDIDFNRHMNTMRYIDMVCDLLPIDELERLNAVRVDMNFMRESRYGDVLSLCVDRRDDACAFEYRSGEGEALCRISLELR
ncbi:acyl-ACP thioesterase [Alistipes sp. Z76]|nr:acyl-ACP thioesterase [Alistipes sp. Z76]NCE68172.1 acyl-ACP thioesterase [Muribaculaceae bacterium M3]